MKWKEGISNKTLLQHPQQNTKHPKWKHRYDIHSKGLKGYKGHQIRHQNTENKRLHINQRDQWATGANLGRPSAKLITNGMVIRITCTQPSHSSCCTEVSKNAQLWYKIGRRLSDKLLSQGYVCDRLTSSLRKFYGRYRELVIHYDVPLSRMVDDILS